MSIYEAAKEALEALEDSHQNINPERSYAEELARQIAGAITALRAALAEDVPETNFGNMAQVVEPSKTDHIAGVSNMVATSQESRQVEPVAYITGYYHGYTVINSVDHRVLLPVGMALYRSPWQREPLTDEELRTMWRLVDYRKIASVNNFARAIERAHGIGGEE